MSEKNDKTRLQEQVEHIAKQCELLVEDYQWYEDMSEEEQASYDKACETLEGEIGVAAYLQDVYDEIFYIHRDYKEKGIDGVRICVAWGGPNIYINTYTGYVEGVWWGDSCKVQISDGACDLINDYYNELGIF